MSEALEKLKAEAEVLSISLAEAPYQVALIAFDDKHIMTTNLPVSCTILQVAPGLTLFLTSDDLFVHLC